MELRLKALLIGQVNVTFRRKMAQQLEGNVGQEPRKGPGSELALHTHVMQSKRKLSYLIQPGTDANFQIP